MASLRTHDVVLADGTFRIVLTEKHRVLAVLDAPTTALGPLHIVLAVARSPFLPNGVSPLVLSQPTIETGFDLGDIGKAVSHAAEGAFNAASKVSTTIARPAFEVVKAAAGEGTHLLAHAVPFLPEDERRKLDTASRVIMRAKLGDLTAKQFIRGIADAAKAGEHAATHIGDTLLDASKIVSHIAELPLVPLEHVPGLGPIVKGVSPFQTWDHIADAVKKGDFKALESIAKQQLSLAQGVVSLIPGVGTGISMAISAGLAVLEGGGALEVAIKTAYGALPIPPGIRQVTDVVLDTVLALAFHHESLTDVVVNVARDQVPAGFPRDVYDTLVNIVVKHKPIVKVAGGLVDHFVQQYAPKGVGIDLSGALSGAVGHLPNMLAALPPGVPQGLGHVFAPLHGPHPGAPLIPPHATPPRLPASPRMVQPLGTALA
jgi:hypothetical protein